MSQPVAPPPYTKTAPPMEPLYPTSPCYPNGPYGNQAYPQNNYSHQGGTVPQPVVVQVVPQPNFQATAGIKDYMAMNIIFMLCCCLPFGIVAVIKSNECQNAKNVGDVPRAKKSSAQAKTWGIITLIFGLVFLSISIGYYAYTISYLTSLSDDFSNYWFCLQKFLDWYLFTVISSIVYMRCKYSIRYCRGPSQYQIAIFPVYGFSL